MGLIHYEVDEDVHKRAKAAAALEGVTLKVFLEQALAEKADAVLTKKR